MKGGKKIEMNKKGNLVFFGFFWVLAIIGILIIGSFSTKMMLKFWGNLGGDNETLKTPFDLPNWYGFGTVLENFLNFLFSVKSIETFQQLVIYIIIFFYIGFCFFGHTLFI